MSRHKPRHGEASASAGPASVLSPSDGNPRAHPICGLPFFFLSLSCTGRDRVNS